MLQPLDVHDWTCASYTLPKHISIPVSFGSSFRVRWVYFDREIEWKKWEKKDETTRVEVPNYNVLHTSTDKNTSSVLSSLSFRCCCFKNCAKTQPNQTKTLLTCWSTPTQHLLWCLVLVLSWSCLGLVFVLSSSCLRLVFGLVLVLFWSCLIGLLLVILWCTSFPLSL